MGRDGYGLHGPFDGRIGQGHHLPSSFIDCRMLFGRNGYHAQFLAAEWL